MERESFRKEGPSFGWKVGGCSAESAWFIRAFKTGPCYGLTPFPFPVLGARPQAVTQVSQPAVSRVSKPAVAFSVSASALSFLLSAFPVSAFEPSRPQPSTAAVQEGLLREFARKGDAFHDVVMMALLRKEWPPAQKLDRPGASVATQKALSWCSTGTTGRGIVKNSTRQDRSRNGNISLASRQFL